MVHPGNSLPVSGVVLTEADLACLKWSADLNRNSIGFLGPTVKRSGPVDVYSETVAKGLARCVEAPGKPSREWGYWITEAGRAALAAADTSERKMHPRDEPQPFRREE